MRILYHQADDRACMHSYELIRGFMELGHEVYSNIFNYDGLHDWQERWDYDKVFVSTSGAQENRVEPPVPYSYVDGRDTQDRSVIHREAAEVMFKTNGKHGRKLPACVDPAWLTPPSTPRPTKITFLTGHHDHGRGDVVAWLHALGHESGMILDDAVPLNPHYPAQSCNIYSQKYHNALQDSIASVDGPGGGVVTKRFFEIIGSGCVLFNFVPEEYHQHPSNILEAIPAELHFPNKKVVTFSTRAELEYSLLNLPREYAEETYAWAQTWTFKDKARYVLKYA